MKNIIFPQFKEIQEVFYLRQNKLKKTIYYIFGILLFGIPFYIFKSYGSLQTLIYDIVDDLKEADFILILYKKETQLLIVNIDQMKLIPYEQPKLTITCKIGYQMYYYDEHQLQFRKIGDLFFEYIQNKKEKIFDRIKCIDDETVTAIRKIPSFIDLLQEYSFQLLNFMFYVLIVINLLLSKYVYAFTNFSLFILNFFLQRNVSLREIENANKLSQKPKKVNIFRKIDGQIMKIEVLDTELVIGDIIEIFNKQVIHSDLLILQGKAVVDESSLTGENFPVLKNNYKKEKIKQDNVILSGSKILETQNQRVYGLVMRTSWYSFQGEFICAVGKKKEKYFDIQYFLLKIFTIVFIISFIIVGIRIFIFIKLGMNVTLTGELFLLLQLFDYGFPTSSLISIYLNEYLNVNRLSKHDIQKLSQDLLINSARVRQICFDKTGTLTQQDTKFHKLIICDQNNFYETFENLNNLKVSEQGQRIYELFLCCNSLLKINDKIKGDPIEIEMFEKTKSDITTQIIQLDTEEQQILTFLPKQKKKQVLKKITISKYFREKYQIQEQSLSVIQTFQFDPVQKRMGVLIKNISKQKQNEFVYLCKGAPEKIIQLCQEDSLPNEIEEQIHHYSNKGYRILAMSYSSVVNQESDQNECEKDMKFLGFIAFKNELKNDTRKNILELRNKNYNVCMITGDALETSVSIGYKSGIIKEYEKVYIGKYDKVQNDIIWIQHENNIGQQRVVDRSSLSSYNIKSHVMNDLSIKENKEQQIQNILLNCQKNDYVLAIEGNVFQKIILNLKDETIKEQILQNTKIFARCKPEQKKKIVQIFRKKLFVKNLQVAFIGDGANDSFALKEADIGLSIGQQFSGLSTFICKQNNISKFKEILIEAQYGFECVLNYILYAAGLALYLICFCIVLPFFYQNYGNFEYILRFTFYIEIPFIFILGSSDKLSNILPSFKFNTLKNIFFLSFNFLSLIVLTFIIFQQLFSTSTHKFPNEVIDATKIDYTDGDQFLFVEKKYLVFAYLLCRVHFRYIYRVGYPFGKGFQFSQSQIFIYLYEIILVTSYLCIWFLDNITQNEVIMKFYVKYIRMPSYSFKQKMKFILAVYLVNFIVMMTLWNMEKYINKNKIKKSYAKTKNQKKFKILNNQIKNNNFDIQKRNRFIFYINIIILDDFSIL